MDTWWSTFQLPMHLLPWITPVYEGHNHVMIIPGHFMAIWDMLEPGLPTGQPQILLQNRKNRDITAR